MHRAGRRGAILAAMLLGLVARAEAQDCANGALLPPDTAITRPARS